MRKVQRSKIVGTAGNVAFWMGWALCAAACSGSDDEPAATPEPPAGSGGTGGADPGVPPEDVKLDEKFADLFTIGAAVDPNGLVTHADLLLEHFNSLTPENDMKFESLQRTEGNFTFTNADAIVDFASQNGMRVRGHALVWHRQTPAWMFVDAEGAPASEELLFERLRAHVSTVVGHYKGRVQAWDVVNEAMMDDGRLRTNEEEREDQRSPWYGIAQERYIAEAFRAANEADPDAKLFYNDYYDWIPVKHQAIYEMLRGLLEQGVPVHGVGVQTHVNIEQSPVETSPGFTQSPENLEAAIALYSSLGLEVHVTEMDMSVYVQGVPYAPEMFYNTSTFTTELAERQGERYRAFFDVFRRHADTIGNVTFWGVADDNSWLSEFSSGRQDFPLLFDRNHQPKPAFFAITDF